MPLQRSTDAWCAPASCADRLTRLTGGPASGPPHPLSAQNHCPQPGIRPCAFRTLGPTIAGMTTTIRLRGAADIITALPYHLGYHPSESLVLVCLRASRLDLVGRIDLPPPDVDPQLVVDELLPLVEQHGTDRAVLVAFESRMGQSEATSAAMRDALHGAGVDVVERLRVCGERWWSLDCRGDCCPPEGELLPAAEKVPAVAQYVVMGRRPADTREGLAQRLVHEPDPDQDARCAILMHRLQAKPSRAALQRRWRTALRHWGGILDVTQRRDVTHGCSGSVGRSPAAGDEAWAEVVVSLLDVQVRDLLIAWLCPGTLDLGVFPAPLRRLAESYLPPRASARGQEGAPDSVVSHPGAFGHDSDASDVDDGWDDRLVERLAMVCRRAPRRLSPGPLTVLAYVAWWLGDGALARTAVEQALEVDPGYRLAALLERMVDMAVRPRRSA